MMRQVNSIKQNDDDDEDDDRPAGDSRPAMRACVPSGKRRASLTQLSPLISIEAGATVLRK